MRKHFASLFHATEDCLESVTVEFFSKGLISRDVRRSPSFYKIENEFVASLSFCEEDMTKLEKKCRAFVHCLAKASGPAKDAAIVLAEDWEREVLNKHNLRWSLKIDIETSTDLSLPSEIPLSSDDEVPLRMQYLHDKFISVMNRIRTYYNECKQYKVEDLASYLIEDAVIPLEKPIADCKNFASLFESVKAQTHYNFFNFELIEDLAKQFPLSDEIGPELHQYIQELEQFKKSTALQQMEDAIKQVPLPHQASEKHCKIVIKLSGSWNRKTIDRLQSLIQYLFIDDAKRASLIKINKGSITVTFLVLSKAQPLIKKVQKKIKFLQCLGIFQIVINDEVVINREEDVNFTFEDSLLHAINHIDSNAEYERVALLLIELKIKLNYKNTDGQTALMLASVGGHIEIFKSLLQNCTDPFVQLPANEGYIGLNHLACTALSQHIYKSSGGEKIMPRDDTSVEDMLEMAVKERGVSRSSYSSFVLAHLSFLRAKFRWLQNCFDELNSKFFDIATNILTSNTLVRDARQNFQLYIKEDDTCENAHQLVQLLQPHYSCLNINVLTIPCTITELIKEQVEEYNTNLKMFKDTTSLLELAMITKGIECPDGVGYSKLILKFNKSWCSKTIAQLNKMENLYLSPISLFLSLRKVHRETSSLTCAYLIYQIQTLTIMNAVYEQIASLYQIGVFEAFVDDIPMMMEDEDESFIFEVDGNEFDVKFKPFYPPLENDNIALMSACRRGDFLTVQSLLSKDPDINIQDNDGATALMLASASGHHQVVELLLSKDPDINIQDSDGWTALMAVSRLGHHQVVELLLGKDPDVNIQNKGGGTALIDASGNGYYKIVELLLSKDPDLNIQNNDGWTALIAASHFDHPQVVELLLSKDPDINIQNNERSTALMVASRYGHHQVVTLLLSKDPDTNIQDIDGWTALIAATRNVHHQVVELLLSKDPDINIQDNYGYTALMHASANGHYQVVELLLSKEQDINIQNKEGYTALMYASAYGHHQVVERLLNKNPDIDIRGNNGSTALIYTCRYGHHQVVELLLSKDPNINSQTDNGVTALMVASGNDDYQAVELLLSKDPDINIQNNEGWTALMVASGYGYHRVVELLLSRNPEINIQNNRGWTSLMAASENGHHQVVELLLSKDPDINIQNKKGLTALISASRYGNHQVVELLLSKDPDINFQNNGWTALMVASRYGHHQVVELLLSKDPDINIQDNDGMTALMFASGNDHRQVVELLLSKDPDINIKNIEGSTALIGACADGYHQVVELLLSKDPDINIQNNNGWTALLCGCFFGYHQVVELLLSKNPDINIQDKDFNAFTLTLGCSNFILTNVPMDDGISLGETEVGTQLLSNMQSGNFVKILKLLLNSHPNHIHIIGGKNLHSLAVAALYNNFDAVEILMKKCDITSENIISAISLACYVGHSSMIIHLSEKTTTLSTNEKKLLVAAAEGDLGTLISMIYEVGLSPDTPLVAGITPLMVAASCGHIELVEALIQAGTDVSQRNDEGMNALDIVYSIEFYDRSDIEELLITNTPDDEPDPASDPVSDTESSNAESSNKQPNTVTISINALLNLFKSYMTKKACSPYYQTQKELKMHVPSGVAPYSAMTSNRPLLVF